MTGYGCYLPRKVEFARDAIVRCIQDRRLDIGDRLPSYSQLRTELGLGSQTIAAAVGSLCELGVLEVRDKVGIFVKDPAGGQLAGRTIAVVVRSLAGSAYSALLASFIQKLISEHNCRCLAFYQQNSYVGSPSPDFDEFPGLEQAVNERRFDGVITMCPFTETALKKLADNNIKCCFIGDDDHNTMPYSVVIEVKQFLATALESLQKSGCKRVVQLCSDREQLMARRDYMSAYVGIGYDGGAEIAREIIALAPEQRPDGIISDDDTLVSGLLAELTVYNRRNRDRAVRIPVIATIIHSEVGERYPEEKMILFSQNIEEYAGMAVDLLMQLLQGKRVHTPRLSYRFQPVAAR